MGFRPSFLVPDGMDEILQLVRAGVISNPDAAQWRNS
jgi:hypothetical protein